MQSDIEQIILTRKTSLGTADQASRPLYSKSCIKWWARDPALLGFLVG